MSVLGTDTVICFTFPQAKELAKTVVTEKNQDTVIQIMIQKDILCQNAIVNQQEQITNLKVSVDNMKTIDTLRMAQLADFEKIGKLHEKELKREKIKRKLIIIGGISVEILTVMLFVLL
jgi:hypothetical protein